MTALKKILVVDDELVVRKSLDRVLTNKGYAVVTANNGEEALSKIAAEKYDAVFADVLMPGMSGLEVTKAIKARQPWLPVVIITGASTEDEAKQAGADGFLKKPLAPEDILQLAATATAEVAKVEEVVAQPEPIAVRNRAKDVALFLLAPFIGLAYLLAFPAIGFGIMAYALYQKSNTFRRVSQMFMAPFVTVAFVTLGPIVGLGTLAYMGMKRAVQRTT